MKARNPGKPGIRDRQTGNGVVAKAAKTPQTNHRISDGEIAMRAYELYVARGCCDGRDLEDWFIAEQQLRKERGLD